MLRTSKFFLLLAVLAGFMGVAHAAYEDEPQVSTSPIGSPFYRHLAYELHMDLRQLVKFEKRGFGRTEICTLILISSTTNKPLKEYGKRRLKDKVTLRELAAEAHMNYDDLHAQALTMKLQIEKMGDSNLPPPVYEASPTPTPSASPEEKKKEKKKSKEKPPKDPTKEFQ